LSATNPMMAKLKPTSGSRVGNGKDILPGVDGRSAGARRYRELAGELARDLGGDPSGAQQAIIRRAATLSVWCEQAEADFANGKDLDIQAFTTATNALRRLLADLGLERKAKDITPDLATYVRQHGAKAEGSS
jgi:hypothetical protein